MKRLIVASLTLVLMLAAPAVLLAESYTGSFKLSVTIPPTIDENAGFHTVEAVEEMTENQNRASETSTVRTVRNQQPVILKTSVIR